MKLLVVTQAVDVEDPVLGFFVQWIEEFSKHVERVEIICLKEGKHALPENVRVHSLGKERAVASRLTYAIRFKMLIWKLRNDYETVFVHMNPEYVVIGGVLWHMLGKRIGLWYVHRSVNLKLRIAAVLADYIFTASPEGFLLATPKLHVVGHGVDTEKFRAPIRQFGTPVRIVSVGRITPIKNFDTLIEAVALLKEKGIDAHATIIGAPISTADEAYQMSLKELAAKWDISDRITFAGSVPHAQMPEQYSHFDISVNLSPTGGLDKAVLESIAAGLLVFVSNRGFVNLLGTHANKILFHERDATECANRIAALVHHTDIVEHIRTDLSRRVETMSVQTLIPRILSFYEKKS